jgi:hypothetical protein
MRAFLTVGFALFVALATGNAPLLPSVCTQQCDDDDASGHCGPTCSDCACCSHAPATTAAPAAIADVVTSEHRLSQRTVASPPSPEPREILHVPIA